MLLPYTLYHRKCMAPQPWGSGARCGKPFDDNTGRRKFCSDACRAANHREKHRPARQVAALRKKLSEARQTVIRLERALEKAVNAL